MAAHDSHPTATDRPQQQDEDRPHMVPDEDGPHDVPDDEVIEETLPSRPVKPLGEY